MIVTTLTLQLKPMVGRNEMRASSLLEGFAGVGPVEGMCDGRVVVGDELADLGFESLLFMHGISIQFLRNGTNVSLSSRTPEFRFFRRQT